MKNFIISFVLLLQLFSQAQNIEGLLLKGSKPILKTSLEKIEDQYNSLNMQNRTNASTALVGTSSEIGITEGTLSVLLNGSANYNVPIAVPPGINNIEPQLSLDYNSQRGNGIAGFGWNIKGVSVITKIPSTKFHDGTIDPVDFDNSDRYAIDGQRLVLKNLTDAYGADGVQYETEQFSNLKITSYGVHPDGSTLGPAYFKVEYPDGSIAFYGNSTDSRTKTDWAITYSQNTQGVRINYSYLINFNSIYISSISYGALFNANPINVVNFDYSGFVRSRIEESFTSGYLSKKGLILNKIAVIGDGVGYRNYELTYNTTDLGYDRLIKIIEKNGSNTLSYNPLIFSYEDTPDTLTQSTLTSNLSVGGINFDNSGNVTGDFNGDGRMDVVIYSIQGTNAKKEFWLYDDLQGSSLNIGYSSGTVDAFEEIFATTWLSWNSKLMPYQGITLVQKNSTNSANVSFNTYYDAPGISFQYAKQVTFPDTHTKKYLSGDFNGDGLTDVIAIDTSPMTNAKTYFIDLDRRKTTNFFNFSGLLNYDASNTAMQLFVADFNGDGKTDIINFCPNVFTCVYGLNDSNQMTLLFCNSEGIMFPSGYKIYLGDYNGDGKSDFMLPDSSSGNIFKLYTSTGNSFQKTYPTYPFSHLPTNSIYSYTLIPNDYNNDGKTDISMVTSARYSYNSIINSIVAGDSYGYISVTNYKNMGGSYVMSSSKDIGKNPGPISTSNLGSSSIKRYPVPVFLTSNSTNLNLSISFLSNNSVFNLNSNKDFGKEYLLKSVTNGNGIVEDVTYSPLIQTGCIPYCTRLKPYTQDYSSPEVYPKTDIVLAPNLQVVSSISKNGLTQDYGYFGAVSNTEGLGFLGFKAVAKTNFYNTTDIPMITSVSIFDMNLRGALSKEYFKTGIPTTTLNIVPADSYMNSSYTYNTYDNVTFEPTLLSNKVLKLKNTIIESNNALGGTSERNTLTYDNFNNLTSYTLQKRLGTTVQKTLLSEFQYDNAPTASTDYHIGRLINKKETSTVGADIMKTESQYTYGTGVHANLPTQVISFVNNNSAETITKAYNYDSYGNCILETIAGSDGTTRTNTYEYEASNSHYGGRFMTKSTNVNGLFVTNTYDTSKGLVTSQTSPLSSTSNPIFTNYSYDSWGKIASMQNYLGTNLTNSLTYTYTNDLLTSNTYSIATLGNDGSENKTVFDPLDRPFIMGEKNISGIWSYKQTQYDASGRKTKVSEPYFSTVYPPIAPSNTLWNQASYDIYGRVNQIIDATTKTISVNYSGLTTTVNDSFKNVVYTKNATGTIASVTDPGGTITYDYYANDALKSSTFGTNIVTVSQDAWGRKTALFDPAAGNYTYTYNLLGETLTETTPKGTTTYTVTPQTGMLTQKTIVGDLTNSSTTYTYDAATKLLVSSRFTDVLGGYYTDYTYEYDAYKRIYRISENNPYAFFQHAILYDGYSRPQYEYYNATDPSNSKVSQKWITHTYLNGYHWQIKDGNTGSGAMLWQTQSVNERGQVLTALYGNSVGTETHVYNATGFQTNVNYKKNSPLNVFLDLGTDFNIQNGNLNSRTYTSSNINSNQTFGYDNLNLDRLTSTTENGVTKTQNYDNMGRISSNELGLYNYTKANSTPSNPFTNTSITIDQNNPANLDYYWTKYPIQQIEYNAFKKPVTIYESNRERIDFQYNDFLQRSTMFYGGTQTDKMQRPMRRSYSADGSMEITTMNPNSGSTSTFITYIGGDAYTAPLILKSDGTTQNYYYLHRDYLGSILAISDAAGQVIEKRLFDAWGQLIQYADGAGNTIPVGGRMFIDRGYTGHEHLFPSYSSDGTTFKGYGLINMNGRLYDPNLHRFLMPDSEIQNPYNTQNYNRYAYVLNNPLKYIDPSGEEGEPTGGSDYSGYYGNGLASLGYTLSQNWDDWGIKDWTKRNFNIKNIGNSVSRGLKSVGKWVEQNIKSIGDDIASFFGFGGGSYKPPIRKYQLNGPLPSPSSIDTGNFMSGSGSNNQPSMFNNFSVSSSQYASTNYSQSSYGVPISNQVNSEYDTTGFVTTTAGTLATAGEVKMFNKNTWYSIKQWKTYGQHFNGNGATGGKLALAKKVSTGFKIGGYGLGAFNAYSVNQQYNKGEIGTSNMIMEQSSNLYSTIGGIYGAAWGVGWESGRYITKRSWYQRWKENTWYPWRYEHFGY